MRVRVKNIIDKNTFKAVAISYKEHKKYKKYITTYKNYLVHFDGENIELGQDVFINQSRPISKRKRWTLGEAK